VIGAINVNGELVAFRVKQGSILKQDVIDFFNTLAVKCNFKESAIYLDNLRAHHSVDVKECAKKN
jgi:hypothetical protein